MNRDKIKKSLGGDERGAMAVIMAGVVVGVVGLAALAVDMGQMYDTQNQLQVTADASALAGVMSLPDAGTATAIANSFADKNMPSASHGDVLANSDIVVGTWNQATRTFSVGGTANAVRVTTRRAAANTNPMKTLFAPAIGINQADLKATATAAAIPGGAPWDVLIVQDVTASFQDEIADARTADQTLLTCLKANTSNTSRVGVATFTGVGAILSNWQNLASGFDALSTKVGQLNTCGNPGMPACSGTNIAAGLNTATNMYTASPSPEGRKRAIILVSDGEPNPTNLKPAAIAAANAAALQGLSVFTIFFDRDNNATARTFLASLVRGEGIALSTPNAAQLSALVTTLCTGHAPAHAQLVN